MTTLKEIIQEVLEEYNRKFPSNFVATDGEITAEEAFWSDAISRVVKSYAKYLEEQDPNWYPDMPKHHAAFISNDD